MSKFRVKLKVTGLELEIEGSREDVPLIGAAIGQQFSGLMSPASAIVEGEMTHAPTLHEVAALLPSESTEKRSAKKRPSTKKPSTNNTPTVCEPIALEHDSSKWGFPNQNWTVNDKVVWLLYVIKNSTDKSELTEDEIVVTFNRHFRQAKILHKKHVARELNRLKVDDQTVGEDANRNPSTWFLTQKGDAKALSLVEKSKSSA